MIQTWLLLLLVSVGLVDSVESNVSCLGDSPSMVSINVCVSAGLEVRSDFGTLTF